jgi:hypothetical protein
MKTIKLKALLIVSCYIITALGSGISASQRADEEKDPEFPPLQALVMEEEQLEVRLGTLLSRHGINIKQEETWPDKQIIALDANAHPYALRFKCDPSQKKFALSLEKEAFGEVIVDLLAGNIPDIATPPVEHTFVVNGEPHFIKFDIDPTFKVTLERISTPLHFYMTTTAPIIVQNGIDEQIFGIIESREGSILLGVRKDVMLGYNALGDCTFKPADPELSTCALSLFNNNYGGVYAPKGKLLIAAHDSISNGHGIQTQVTTTFVSKSANITKDHNHKFYTGGNGSFMQGLLGIMLNSRYISNLYNEIEAYGGDIVLQGPQSSFTRITGNVKTSGNMWIMTNQYDLRQDREDVSIQNSYWVTGLRVGEVSLSHGYPYVKMEGHHHIRCDYVHINHPSGGWQPHIADVPYGRESTSNYNNNGGMIIKVHTGISRILNLDTGNYIYLD